MTRVGFMNRKEAKANLVVVNWAFAEVLIEGYLGYSIKGVYGQHSKA